MKKLYYLIIVLFIYGCSSGEVVDAPVHTIEEQFTILKSTKEQLMEVPVAEKNKTLELGRQIQTQALTLYINHHDEFQPKDQEFLLKCAAIGAEAAKRYNDAVNYFLKAQRNFPKSENAPTYLHNRARILDDILLDKNNARLAYEELIELYPEHPLSQNAVMYLENAFGKSNEELLELIKNK